MRIALQCILLCLALLAAGIPTPTWAMGFYVLPPTPLAKELAAADFVVVGMLHNADAHAGTTEAAILTILKDHPGLQDKKHFTLNRYVQTDNDAPTYMVMFGAVVKGELDIYRGVQCSGKDDVLIGYLKGIRDLKKGAASEKLAFYFNYLESRRIDIAQDACREFQDATYAEMKHASEFYDAEKLEAWIADDKIPQDRKELYRVLLVFCQEAPKR